MPLRLVHVSDIHFRGYEGGWDLDHDQRAELLSDVERLVAADGPMDGILVGGDIAFRASAEEYELAGSWLDDLRAVCGGLDTGRVWTVPGNHDVHRPTVESSDVLKQFRSEIRDCALADLDVLLSRRLARDPAGETLVLPFDAYNEFAGEYTCAVTSRSPHWYDETLEVDGLRVRLLGLNSVMISDQEDSNSSERSKLVLGIHQCQVPRLTATVHLVIAHHPPGWVRDWQNVAPYLRRAHVLLFGHEHAYSARQPIPGGLVEIYAGAVGPDRDHGQPMDQYSPTYNVLNIARLDDEMISVRVQPRYWDLVNTCFGMHPEGDQTFEVAISQRTGEPSIESGPDGTDEAGETTPARTANPLDASPDGSSPVVAQARTELRRIGTEYMRLPWTERIRIARELGVLDDEDLQQSPPADLFPSVLRRIRERGLVSRLIEEMDRDRPAN